MFHADITFVLALIALAAGAFLVLFAKAHKEISTVPFTVIGFAIVILSIIVILFSGYGMSRSYAMKRKMMPMMQQMMQGNMPMQKMQTPGQMPMQGPMLQGAGPHHPQMQQQEQMPMQEPMKPEMQMHKQMQPGMKQPMMQGMQPKSAPTSS